MSASSSVANRLGLSQRWNSVVNKFALGVVLLGLWQIASLFFPYYVFPGVGETAAATREVITNPQFGAYHGHLIDTFQRLLVGFVFSVIVGGLLGTMMGLREEIEAFFRTPVILGLSLPSIAVAFGLVIAIGISEWVPVLTVTIIGVPFVMLNMWEGSQEVDQEIEEMADFYGAGRYQRFRDIMLPQLLQYLFPSMYWGLIVSWKVLFIAEVFGAGTGVGYMVNYWFLQQRVDLLLGWVVIPVILVILAQELLRSAEHWLMDWR